MLTVVCWKWGALFGAEYVNRLRNAVNRNLHIPHEFVCVTDDPHGLGASIGTMGLPHEWSTSPRCIRRLRMYDPVFAKRLGDRLLAIDLDVIVTGDLTSLVDTDAPMKFWRVEYANVLSGSFQLFNADALRGLWHWFSGDPVTALAMVNASLPPARQTRGGVITPRTAQHQASDQDVLNYWHRMHPGTAEWSDKDGIIPYFGKGYERYARMRSMDTLPEGTRAVVLGSADKHVIDSRTYSWIEEHWR